MLSSKSLLYSSRPHVRLKLDFGKNLFLYKFSPQAAVNVVNLHTSQTLAKKKKKSRLQTFTDKFVDEDEWDKRPSDLEIKRKDLPPNQPTLKERIERDEWHMFYQKDVHHGYWEKSDAQISVLHQMKVDLKNPKKAMVATFQGLKAEVSKFSDEYKEGEYSMTKKVRDALVFDGSTRKEWGFQSEVEMLEWVLTKDSDWGEGYSSAEFKLNDSGTAGILSGELSTRVPNDGRTDAAGYVNISSKNQRRSFARLKLLEHWQNYTHLTMKVRGDGRKYMINVKVFREYDMHWDDRYHYPLYTRGGPYWQEVKIPFSKFFFGHKGIIQDRQCPIQLAIIQSIAFTLMDRITGPFQLEIKDIGLVRHESGDNEEFAYETYLVPEFWIGAG